jgi:outer membrane protein assembly factor BamB
VKHFILFLSLAHLVQASPWSSYLGSHGNGTAEGDIPAKIQKEGPKVLWKASIGRGCSSFAIDQGKALTVGNSDDKDTLWCFDAKTGDVIWKTTYDEPLAPKYYDGGPGATPTIHEGLVYNLSKSGRLSCHDLKDGKEKWLVQFKDDYKGNKPEWGYSSSPLIYKDLLICLPCSKKGAMVALDKKTGKMKWQSENVARPGYAAPLFYQHEGKDAAVVFHGRSIVGYDLTAKGKVLYEYEWRTPYDVNASNPQVLDNLLHFSAGYNMGYAVVDISTAKPKIVHRNRDLPMIFQNSFIIGDDLMGCFGDKRYNTELYRMDFKTGEILWKHPLPGTRGSTAQIGETTVVLTETGHLVFGKATEKDFTETGRHEVLSKLCWAPLAIGEGKLFARTNKGKAICLDLEMKADSKVTIIQDLKIE